MHNKFKIKCVSHAQRKGEESVSHARESMGLIQTVPTDRKEN